MSVRSQASLMPASMLVIFDSKTIGPYDFFSVRNVNNSVVRLKIKQTPERLFGNYSPDFIN